MSILTQKDLREYQKEAVRKVMSTDIGQIILPTGTGKSTIQAKVIETQIINNSGFGVYAILTPRILLTNQLMTGVIRDLFTVGIQDIKAFTIHSGRTPEIKIDAEEEDFEYLVSKLHNLGLTVTTNSDDIADRITFAKKVNKPIIICSTYDSLPQLVKALKRLKVRVQQVLCDEAHYITQNSFNANVAELMSIADNIHYFTATRKLSVSDDGLGMNNTAMFGEVIYQKTPREMIELGFMVQPRFHIVKAKQDTNKAVSVLEAFREHDLIIREHNADTTGKMLVCCNGTKPVEEIRNSSYIQQAIKNEDITVFSITSEFGCHINNVAYQNRDEFLKILRAHKGKAIVLHVNILTEGIDIPDMSGVLYLRDMTICRFGQSQGRSTRPLAEDLPLPINLRKKQFSYVIVVEYEDDLGSRDHSANIIDMMYNMRELGFNPEEIEVLGQDIGMNVDSEIEDTNQKTRRAYQIGSGADILGHVIEAEGLARLVTDPVEVLDAWLSEE